MTTSVPWSVRDLARAERADLADFLAGLPADRWDAPTLCSEWSVRDVVAHVVSYEGVGPARLARRLVRGVDGANALALADLAGRSPEQLLALLRRSQDPRGLTARFGGRIALVDGIIHHQDIRRALGAPRAVPLDRLRAALPSRCSWPWPGDRVSPPSCPGRAAHCSPPASTANRGGAGGTCRSAAR